MHGQISRRVGLVTTHTMCVRSVRQARHQKSSPQFHKVLVVAYGAEWPVRIISICLQVLFNDWPGFKLRPGSLLDPVKGGALFLLRLSLSPPLVWSRRVAVNDLDGRPHTLQVTVRPCRGNETTTILAAQIKVLNGPTAQSPTEI